MPKTKSANFASSKWVRNAANAATSYQEGVTQPRKDWQAATMASEQNYKDAVTKAASEGRFGKGVAKAGTAKWQTRAAEMGASRFGAGVASAQSAYETAIQPYLNIIANVDIGPHYPKGDPRNIQRVAKITAALHNAKVK